MTNRPEPRLLVPTTSRSGAGCNTPPRTVVRSVAHAEGDIRCIGKSGLSSAALVQTGTKKATATPFGPSPTPAVSSAWRSVIGMAAGSNEMARCGAGAFWVLGWMRLLPQTAAPLALAVWTTNRLTATTPL